MTMPFRQTLVVRSFLRSVVVLLLLTSVAKFWSAYGTSAMLLEIDPLLGVTFGKLMVLAAVLELIVVAACCLRPTIEGLIAIAWLSATFSTYRIGLWWIGWQKPCSCLGNLTDALNISPPLADDFMKGSLALMFVGSLSLLLMHNRQLSKPRRGGRNAVIISSD